MQTLLAGFALGAVATLAAIVGILMLDWSLSGEDIRRHRRRFKSS